jgi:RNA polymerase sigma-70 factor, ECF subfamily
VSTPSAAQATLGEPSDEKLVGSVLGGDREAFALLVNRHKHGIANFIGAGIRSHADIADLTQETFLRAYVHLGTFKPELGRFSTWIYHIARNVVRTFLSRSLKRPIAAEFGAERTLEERLATSEETNPIDGVLRAESEAEVRAALADLPERTRTVLALRYYDNMDYQTIAKTTGLSLGNVKTLIHRGKLALAQHMQKREIMAANAAAGINAGLTGRGALQPI